MLDDVFVAEELRSVGGSGMPSVQGMLDYSLVAPTLRMCAMPPTKELRMDSHVGMAHVCAPKVVT